ncbi:hypothetical protein PILCRDRAFT_595527 [Piloderma croceum F 1598]|uniref:Uncharacterized protein n=1 Tax=Piloderma croceum (strain F 1598) TaxID=765440 RepID=A0A0C3F0K1_PILCF|nr:hypothetical protein PILCRDRAFT_595527 [Piloderma croceum F 1598]
MQGREAQRRFIGSVSSANTLKRVSNPLYRSSCHMSRPKCDNRATTGSKVTPKRAICGSLVLGSASDLFRELPSGHYRYLCFHKATQVGLGTLFFAVINLFGWTYVLALHVVTSSS